MGFWGTFVIAVLLVLGLGAGLAALLLIPMKLINKWTTKNEVDKKVRLWKAQEELEKRKTIQWNCPSCGASNYNREVCEFCGTGKPNSNT